MFVLVQSEPQYCAEKVFPRLTRWSLSSTDLKKLEKIRNSNSDTSDKQRRNHSISSAFPFHKFLRNVCIATRNYILSLESHYLPLIRNRLHSNITSQRPKVLINYGIKRICQQQICRVIAIYRRLSPANFPTFC